MLGEEERQYLLWLASERFEGWGALVDVGPWLGGSTAALAEGLRRRDAPAKVDSIDRFRWEKYMSAFANCDLQEGDDFLPQFLHETREYSRWIQAQPMDLMDCSWDGGPIEILFVDAANTWNLVNRIFEAFGPHLVAGRSRVVLRDFRDLNAHCLPLIFDSRPDVWTQVEDVENGTTVTFMPLKPLLGPSGIDTSYSEESFPLESAERLFRSRMAREGTVAQRGMLLMLYRKYLIDAPRQEAQRLKETICAQGISESELREAEDIEEILLSRGWKALERGYAEPARTAAEQCLSLGERSPEALTLLAFALLRSGKRAEAEPVIDEVLSLAPELMPSRFLRVERAVLDEQYSQAETEALGILKCAPDQESWVEWALHLLVRAWDRQRISDSRLRTLNELAGSFSRSPSFLAHLAREQFLAGLEQEAVHTVERALTIVPGHALALKVWRRIGQARERHG